MDERSTGLFRQRHELTTNGLRRRYAQMSAFQMNEFSEPFAPTNRNTLRRVG